MSDVIRAPRVPRRKGRTEFRLIPESEVRRVVREALGTNSLTVGPLQIRPAIEGGLLAVEGVMNGERVGKVENLDLQTHIIYSRAHRDRKEFLENLRDRIVYTIIEQLEKGKGMWVDYVLGKEPLFYMIGEEGVEVLYPERRFYGWGDGKELLTKYGGKGYVLPVFFKQHARKHGIEYPEEPADAYEYIVKSDAHKTYVVKGRKYYLIMPDEEGNIGVAAEGNTEEELLNKIAEGVKSGKIPLVPPLTEYLRKKNVVIRFP